MRLDFARLRLALRFEFRIPVEIVDPTIVQIVGWEQAAVAVQLKHRRLDRLLRRPHLGVAGHQTALFQIARRARRHDVVPSCQPAA